MKIKMKMSSWVFVKRCPKGYTVYKNLESGLEDIFRKRDTTGKRNSVVYRAWNPNSTETYIGEGTPARPTSHSNDDLANNLGPGWIIEILATGLTKLEAKIAEAYLIRKEIASGRSITQIGTKWNGRSLMNRNKGMSDEQYEYYSKIYLWK